MSNLQNIFSEALSALNKGDLPKAENGFRNVLKLDGNHVPALNLLAVVLMSSKRYREAESFIAKATNLDQNSDVSFYNYGLIAKKLEKYELAYEQFSKALAINSSVAETWNYRGLISNYLKRYNEAITDFDKAIDISRNYADPHANKGKSLSLLRKDQEALVAYDKALSIEPNLAEAWLDRGNVLKNLKRNDESLAAYDKALSIDSDLAGAWLGRGNVFSDFKRHEEALVAYDKALSIEPNSAEAWLGRGNVLKDLKRHDESFAAYDKALSVDPDLAGAWLGRGHIFSNLKRDEEALAAYDKALAIKPDLEGAWLGRGSVFSDLKRHEEALAAYDKALSIKPDLASAWLGRGNVFDNLNRYNEALAAYDKALSIDPDLAGAWHGRGHVLRNLKRYEEAIAAYDKALTIKPDLDSVEAARLHAKMHICRWENLDAELKHLRISVASDKANVSPFSFLSFFDSPEDHLKCSRAWVAATNPLQAPLWKGERYKHKKIRIGYVSADLRQHPIGYLIADLFQRHNRDLFETYAYSIGVNDNSDVRARIVRSFSKFHDFYGASDQEICVAIRSSEIDILVDLNGHTQNARTSIFAQRPAPISVNYLGYAGSMGASYYDYIVGDRTVFSSGNQGHFAEKLVRLPHSFMPHDPAAREISQSVHARSDYGLPDDVFVFCCFNNAYKINPAVFNLWISILQRVPKAVLWLSELPQVARENLRRTIMQAGIDADRILFAKHLDSSSEHLARHQLADLFLDTLPYNAHTTAGDALWAGLPVLTQLGNAFPGRVAASLLNAVNLPELITRSSEQYEALAVELALNPDKLKAIREKLAANRRTTPLFDMPLYTKHLEAAYEAMYQRYQDGLQPDHIDVAAVPRA